MSPNLEYIDVYVGIPRTVKCLNHLLIQVNFDIFLLCNANHSANKRIWFSLASTNKRISASSSIQKVIPSLMILPNIRNWNRSIGRNQFRRGLQQIIEDKGAEGKQSNSTRFSLSESFISILMIFNREIKLQGGNKKSPVRRGGK